MDNPDKIDIKNTKYLQIIQKSKNMFENDKIKDYLYNNFANSKYVINKLLSEIEYMNKLIEKT